MNASEAARLAERIGQQATMTTPGEGFEIQVRVLDARSNFGRIDYLVVQEGSKGVAWVTGERLRFGVDSTAR